MRIDPDRGLTRAQAAHLAGVEPATVSMWALRGWRTSGGVERRLTVVGKDSRGGRLYRCGDVLDAERDTRHHPNSRRGTTRRPATGTGSWADLDRRDGDTAPRYAIA